MVEEPNKILILSFVLSYSVISLVLESLITAVVLFFVEIYPQ